MDHHHEDKNTGNRLIDPVCGMAVTQASKFYEKIDSKTFYFCSEKCKLKFENDPLFYINEEGKSSPTKKSMNSE